MTEVGGRRDAIIARNRCLEAAAASGNIEDGQACWLMAVRYNQRVRTSDPDRPGEDAVGVSRVDRGR